MTEHLDDLVNGVGGPRGHHEGGHGFGGPPPDGSQPPASAGIPVAPIGSPI